MQIEVELPAEATESLEQMSKRLGIAKEELAALAIAEFLRNERAYVSLAIRYSIEQNRELLKRLS